MKTYSYKDSDNTDKREKRSTIFFVKKTFLLVFLIGLLLLASEGIVFSAKQFSSFFNMSLPLVGILIVGFGNCAPEAYFALFSVKNNQGWMTLGNLMGSVIICSTLVLGIVALINPFEIENFSPFVIASIFTILSASLFIFVIRSGKEITKKEGLILIFLYIAFVITAIYFK